jgi:type IV secretory pathway TraG/TraD family ATPase VirD4
VRGKGKKQVFVSVIMDEFSPSAYENLAHILQAARGANVAFLFALQSAPQLLQVGRGFRKDVASAPNATFMLRTKDEETAQYLLRASAACGRCGAACAKENGVFNTTYEEGNEGNQTETKDALAQDEHIKKMPVGQMEMLMTNPFRGNDPQTPPYEARLELLAAAGPAQHIPETRHAGGRVALT